MGLTAASLWRHSAVPRVAAGLLTALVAGATPGAEGRPGQTGAVERGAYLARAAGCVTCHTHKDAGGAPLAGGRAFVTPFGTFYAPNITPDPEHGIGGWGEADLVRALGEGRAPDGRAYFPVFPYPAYTRMSRADVADLWAYLQSVPARAASSPDHALAWYLRLPGAMAVWRWLHFTPGPLAEVPGRSPEWHRGRYLAEALAHCGECHTPRDALGGLRQERHYGGGVLAPDGEVAPNITPHREAGVGRWSAGDLAFFLEIGMTPDGDFTGGSMAAVVDGVTGPLTPGDRKALVVYLRSLEPLPAEP